MEVNIEPGSNDGCGLGTVGVGGFVHTQRRHCFLRPDSDPHAWELGIIFQENLEGIPDGLSAVEGVGQFDHQRKQFLVFLHGPQTVEISLEFLWLD